MRDHEFRMHARPGFRLLLRIFLWGHGDSPAGSCGTRKYSARGITLSEDRREAGGNSCRAEQLTNCKKPNIVRGTYHCGSLCLSVVVRPNSSRETPYWFS
jgi:hypothetical protein